MSVVATSAPRFPARHPQARSRGRRAEPRGRPAVARGLGRVTSPRRASLSWRGPLHAPSPEAWGPRGLRRRARPRAGGFGRWTLAPSRSGRTEARCSRAPGHQEARAAPPLAASTTWPAAGCSVRLIIGPHRSAVELDALGALAGPGGGCWAGGDLGFTFSDLNLCPGGSTQGPGVGDGTRLHSHTHARLWPPGPGSDPTCAHTSLSPGW